MFLKQFAELFCMHLCNVCVFRIIRLSHYARTSHFSDKLEHHTTFVNRYTTRLVVSVQLRMAKELNRFQPLWEHKSLTCSDEEYIVVEAIGSKHSPVNGNLRQAVPTHSATASDDSELLIIRCPYFYINIF